jgi:alpha-glucosidase (family GH31 glycosyl hydrolase)
MVWTADSESTFKYLAISTPMLLGYSMTGVFMNGGDIPGFSYEPTEELC